MGYLEFAGVNHFTAFIFQLKNVNTAVKICYINHCFLGYSWYVKYFFSNKIKNLERIRFIEVLIKVKCDL